MGREGKKDRRIFFYLLLAHAHACTHEDNCEREEGESEGREKDEFLPSSPSYTCTRELGQKEVRKISRRGETFLPLTCAWMCTDNKQSYSKSYILFAF